MKKNSNAAGKHTSAPTWLCAAILITSSAPLLCAQSNSAPNLAQSGPSAAASAPRIFAPSGLNTVPVLPATGMDRAIPAFGQPLATPVFPSFTSDFAVASPFHPAGFAGVRPFAENRRTFSISSRTPDFSPFSAPALDAQAGSFAALFPAGNPPRALSGVATSPFSASPGTLPSLNQFMRGSVVLPTASATGAFRFSYQDTLHPGGSPMSGEFGRPASSAMFTTSNLGNGMFLSAGTSFGPAAGTPAIPTGNSSTGPKRSGSGVAIKLSF